MMMNVCLVWPVENSEQIDVAVGKTGGKKAAQFMLIDARIANFIQTGSNRPAKSLGISFFKDIF